MLETIYTVTLAAFGLAVCVIIVWTLYVGGE